tara:strand:+ start:2201 stop:2842 length:642 start_codon:yes stop_codon:yes gene_type:complete
MKYTRRQIQEAVQDKGYVYFQSPKGYDVNIIGIRNSSTDGRVTNAFDDLITLSYLEPKEELEEDGTETMVWKYHEFPCTTDPGTHWVKNILSESGVAILKPNQYRGSHKIGLHQGKYEALKQKKPLQVYRDSNKDNHYDLIEENIQKGIFGINIHRATAKPNSKSTRVDRWSAGCQVIASSADFDTFMQICTKARGRWGNSFTYTLINSSDIV